MLPKSTFFRENFVVVLGIALPLLLVIVFALARVFSEIAIAPPEFRAVYAEAPQPYGGKFHYNVGVDKKLVVTFEGAHYNGTPRPNPISATTTVFVMDVKTGAVTRHGYTVSNVYAEGIAPVSTNDTAPTVAVAGPTAPDGYVYTTNPDSDYYSGGIIPDMFGYNLRHGNGHAIVKNGRAFPLDTNNIYNPVEFIGWTKD